jgi:hypothetical protein
MMKLCWSAVLVDDQEGHQHTGILLAYAPCEDGVVDTSSTALTRAIVFHEDCQGTAHVRILWTGQHYVVNTGVLAALDAMVKLLNQHLNE